MAVFPPSSNRPAPGTSYDVGDDVLRVDRFMRRFIVIGGIAVILSVLGLFVFILFHALPLFEKASVEVRGRGSLDPEHLVGILPGEFGFGGTFVRSTGTLTFLPLDPGQSPVSRRVRIPEGAAISALANHPGDSPLYLGLTNGDVLETNLIFIRQSKAETVPTVDPVLKVAATHTLSSRPGKVKALDAHHTRERTLLGVLFESGDGSFWIEGALSFNRKSPFGEVEVVQREPWTLSIPDESIPQNLLCGADARSLFLLDQKGVIFLYQWNGDAFEMVQQLTPFPGGAFTRIGFLNGRRTLYAWEPGGQVRFYTPVNLEGAGFRLVPMNTVIFPGEAESPLLVVPAPAKRTLLFLRGNRAGLYYSTTSEIRWKGTLPIEPRWAQFGLLNETLLFVDPGGAYHQFSHHDPFPEAGFRGLFQKVHYEGREAPTFEWQSTGASDSFEPKISLVPLLFGSIKGTFFALIISMPIALCAAVYSAQFMRKEWKTWIRPTIEMMASVPSVILGLLAAIWFAPLLVDRVPSMLSFLLLVPAGAMLGGFIWGRLPPGYRRWISPGRELLVLFPGFILLSVFAWNLGGVLEHLFFRVYDESTGNWIGDFALWWSIAEGRQMEQRNSFIIGVFMGFAVIPLIYTVAEEALSNVPRQLVSGSIALGASRWQTVRRVIIPMAASGILSAIMIGMGRAIGETMIVLMASGNSPILEWNFMSGFRALSANIAIELPEANQGGLLYRSMFLGASMLFLLTFVVNTLADLLRAHLRNRSKVLE